MLTPDKNAIPLPGENHENNWYNQDFDSFRISEHVLFEKRPIRMRVVGAGAVGIQLLYKAQQELENVEYFVYEKNQELGGTWLVNRYPGCTCDIPAHSYQFTWARNPNWSSFYAKSEEIWEYLKDTARRHDLERHIKYSHRVESARWSEQEGLWKLRVHGPEGDFEDECEILVNGSGILDVPKLPDIPGINKFEGEIMHSASWDDRYDLEGKTVAVIGGGSSAVQIVPNIQPKVKKLIPFLRSPVWVTTGFGAQYSGPGGTNFQYSAEQKKRFAEDPKHFDEYCRGLEGELNKRFTLMHGKSQDQKQSRKFVAEKMEKEIDGNEELSEHLIPQFPLGCRRMTPGEGYLKALNAPNVHVVRESVIKFTKNAVADQSGNEYEVDAVICATGFERLFSPHFECIGRNGVVLDEQFGDHPKAYLAIMTQNFPNLFLVLGPNGPVSHGSLLPIFEWYTRYMFKMINKLQRENIKSYEPKPEAMHDIYNYTHELFKRLVWSSVCRSWFKNGKIHGPVTAVYAGSRLHYFELMKEVRYEDYIIQYRSNNRFQFLGNGYTTTETSIDGNPVWYMDMLRDEDKLQQAERAEHEKS
ncbi:cyclohexanone monooxygenase [Rhizodiscina lignyota]|uniref:Cyclohexanone monooxygenase n=1 Tax=Rhizodiscina lignyota TaxID=1504668 RepID=A0A9P4IFM8_9PEZI|nr:cyclohexanone monooxygenase [Rhizodiscina lignyota]